MRCCVLLCGVCCLLSGVDWLLLLLLFVVCYCYLSFGVCRLMFAAGNCCVLAVRVVCWLLVGVCCSLFVVRCVLFVVCRFVLLSVV